MVLRSNRVDAEFTDGGERLFYSCVRRVTITEILVPASSSDRGADGEAPVDHTIGDDACASLDAVAQSVVDRVVVGDCADAAEAKRWTLFSGGDADVDEGPERGSAEHLARTKLHELGHWTGHSARLNRDFSGGRGGDAYAREELVAELCSAFLCAELGIAPTVRHADYLGAWLGILKGDNRAIFQAASLASKAANFVMGRPPVAGIGGG